MTTEAVIPKVKRPHRHSNPSAHHKKRGKFIYIRHKKHLTNELSKSIMP